MRNNRRRRASWSELPSELLLAVAERLETRADILHFRRACKSWRVSAPLSLITPKNILSPLFPHPIDGYPTECLVANSVFLLRSAINPKLKPWIVFVEESNPGKLSVTLPFYRSVDRKFAEKFSHHLDLSQCHVSELARFYSYEEVDKNGYSKEKFPLDCRVVLFVNPDCTDEFIVVELPHYVPLYVRRVENGIIGAADPVYTWGRKLDDIVCFKGKIYGVDRKGRVCSMDYNSLKMSKIVEEPLCEVLGRDSKKWLAVTCGELYLVYAVYAMSSLGKITDPTFKVYKLNEEEKRWDKLEQGIGNDRILSVTDYGCFFASAKDFLDWRGNCIVFHDDCFPLYSLKKEMVKDLFVYHFESRSCGRLASIPSYNEVLWPPPSWLWTDASLVTGVTDSGSEGREDGDGDEAEDGAKLQSGSSSQVAPDHILEEKISPSYAQVAKRILNVQQPIAHEGCSNQNNVDSAPAMNSSLKTIEKDVSQMKFLGVDVSSHSFPILQKIWAKHGNITEGHVVTSDSLLTWALESLAKIVIILQSNSGRSLDDS